MRRKIAILLMLGAALLWSVTLTADKTAPPTLEDLARTVLRGSQAEAAEATAALRQAGQAGMKAMLALDGSPQRTDALDRVCGVRDCADIRLFWYTDLEAAKAAARATGKPILSLRLMGRLDEEFSCANSRFFRTVFYKNGEINKLLRDRFVLHWRSVRPVPRVTIDFGDGSRLEQTLTGDSIHYVLDSRGRLVEALPGLYGPAAFQNALKGAAQAAGEATRLDDKNLVRWATARHERQLNARGEAFSRDLRASWAAAAEAAAREETEPVLEVQPEPEVAAVALPALSGSDVRDPWAILQAAPGVLVDRIRVGGNESSKMAGEVSILVALELASNDQLRQLAQLRRPQIHLDPASRAFLMRKHGVKDPQEAEKLVDAFETTVALDEVTNEYRTGPAILRKLSNPEFRSRLDLEAFNLWVYEEVFRTPLSDPWLGLAPKDVYVALPASMRASTP